MARERPVAGVCIGHLPAVRHGIPGVQTSDMLFRGGIYFIIWPRSSPPGFAAVWMFAYHLPASRSAAWLSVSVAFPLIGLSTVLNGSTMPAFFPASTGP